MLLVGAATTITGAGHAQAAADATQGASLETTKTDSGDIIVTAKNYVPTGAMTANKTDIPLIQTPQSISVITRDQIDLLNFIDAQQAVRYTAGVFGENYGPDPRYDFFTVRGFTPKQYIDGLAVPATTTISSVGVDLYAFQSLDILKGPASVLYGAAPPGGIVNEVSRRASSQFGGEAEVKYGSHQFAEGAMTITGPVADMLDVRFTGLYRDNKSEIDDTHGKRLLAAPTATLKIDDRTKLTGLLYYQYDNITGGQGGFLPAVGTLLPNPNGRGKLSRHTNLDGPYTDYERRQFAAGYDFEHRFSDAIRFTSNTKWSHYKESTPTGLYGGGGYTNIGNAALPSYYNTIQQYNFSYQERVRSFATDNRLDATIVTGPITNKLLAGVDYRNVANLAAFGFTSGPTVNAYNPAYVDPGAQIGYPFAYNNERLRQTGVYGQDQINFGDLYVTLGGRYDWVTIDDNIALTKTKQHKFTYRAGANYVTPSGITPYVSYATSFEPVLGTDSITARAFKPSAGKQWEGGVKYDARGLPQGIKIFATAALFDIKQTNVVSTSPSITPVFGTQSGKVEVYGGELEVVARIYDQLTINAAYSYNHSKVLASYTLAEVGAPLPVTPKNKASLFADYTFKKGAIGGLGFGFGARYTDGSAGVLPGPFNTVYFGQKSTLFDAIVHYDMPGWRLAVNGSNIFDKNYVARCSGAYGCVYGAGRQIIGTVTKKF